MTTQLNRRFFCGRISPSFSPSTMGDQHNNCLERFDGDAESKTTGRTPKPVGMRTRKLRRRPRRWQALK